MAKAPSEQGPRTRQEKALEERSTPRQHVPRVPPAFQPADWEPADVSAIQALERGSATPEQQKRALNWWLYKACGLGQLAFRPGGEDGRRNTDFALGRQFPAQQTVKLMRLNLGAIPRRDSRADQHEDK